VAEETTLVKKFAPLLNFYSKADGYPTSAEAFFKAGKVESVF
jgi:hypothetical protein